MPAPFRIPDFSEPLPGERPTGAIPTVTADEALNTIAKMLEALHSYSPAEAMAIAAAHARTTLARAGRPYAPSASRHTALDASVHSGAAL